MQITNVLIHQPVGLLRIQTDTELEGWCLGVGTDDGQKIQQRFAGAVIDQNPIDRERLWLELLRLDTEQDTALRGYIDTALWDLVAKAIGQPVYRMIGGFRSRTPAYLAGGTHDDFGRCVVTRFFDVAPNDPHLVATAYPRDVAERIVNPPV